MDRREFGRRKNSFDTKQLNTYSPFFQNQDLDDFDKEDTKWARNGSQKSGREREENINHSNHIYHINNGSNHGYYGTSIIIVSLLSYFVSTTITLKYSPLARIFLL